MAPWGDVRLVGFWWKFCTSQWRHGFPHIRLSGSTDGKLERWSLDVCRFWVISLNTRYDGRGIIAVFGCLPAREFCGENAGRLQAPLEQDQRRGGRRHPDGGFILQPSPEKSCFYRLWWGDDAKTTRGKPWLQLGEHTDASSQKCTQAPWQFILHILWDADNYSQMRRIKKGQMLVYNMFLKPMNCTFINILDIVLLHKNTPPFSQLNLQ